ncbi:transposase [Ensifer sp. YR511]|uniref:transposase n=1 Tax=Ensifer sp. YR511 TaxID=1855294 RepID=UPI00088CD71E|nr:transposase [Ensifer sp. YR511]SDN05390.1 putative transposase [Ensifer sp. YR511]
MADESSIGTAVGVVETSNEVKASPSRKQVSRRARKHSPQERTEKLRLIETQISDGKNTLKGAVEDAGISEQTYYLWKRALKLAEHVEEKPIPIDHELADLAQLERENQRLRGILAEKLRAENAELRKRLALN